MLEYKIGEAAENPMDSTIEKRGYVQKFTLREAENTIFANKKTLKELEGRVTLDAAKMANIEQNHPFVLEMSEQDLFTCHMYMEAKATVRVCEKNANKLRTAIEEDEAEILDIKAQIPELALTPSPAEFTGQEEINNDAKEE